MAAVNTSIATDKATLLAIAKAAVTQCPDLHVSARQTATQIMARHGVTGLDPDKVWWHHWSNSHSSPLTYTGWEHIGVPVESLTLPQLVMRRFNPADQDNADLLHQMGGFYTAGPHAGTFDQRNEVRLDPAEVLNDFWRINFASMFGEEMAEYWAQHTEDYRTLAKVNYLSKALQERKAERISNEDLYLLFKAVGAHQRSPVGLTNLAARASAPEHLKLYAFDVRGHQASDIVRILDQSTGYQYLFIPGDVDAFHVFETSGDLYFWVLNQTNESANRARFMAHFPLSALGEGDHDSVGLNHTLDLLFYGWGPHAQALCQNNTPIKGDLFDFLTDNARNRMQADATYALHSNGQLLKKMWQAYLGAALSVFGPMAAMGAPVALLLLGAGIASLGLSIDQAVNGRTAAERNAGLQATLNAIESLFETAVLWGLDSVTATGETGFLKTLEAGESPPHYTPARLPLDPAQVEPLLPEPLQPRELSKLLEPFETNEIPDGPAPMDAAGRMRGIELSGDGTTFADIDGLAYQVRYAKELGTWVVVDPQNPFSFYRNVPIRFTKRNRWEVLSRGGLKGGIKFFGKLPWGSSAASAGPSELTPTYRYDIPAEIRSSVEYIAEGHGDKLLTGDYFTPATEAPIINQVLAIRKGLVTDAAAFFEAPTLPARPEIPTLDATAREPEIIEKLLETFPGIVIGEGHSSIASKRFLIENMKTLVQQKVRTLYMEHLQTDFQQIDLDAFARTGKMSDKLEKYLNGQDRGHGADPSGRYNFTALVRAAAKHHIRVQAIDCLSSYRLNGLPDSDGTLRQKSMNYFADLVMSSNQATRGDEKWVALVGNTYSNTYGDIPGLAELKGAVGLRIDDVPPGTSLGIRPDPGLDYSERGDGRKNVVVKNDLLYQGETLAAATEGKLLEQRLTKPGMFGIDNENRRIIHRSRDNKIVYTPIELERGFVYIKRPTWSYVNERRFVDINDLANALQGIGLKWTV